MTRSLKSEMSRLCRTDRQHVKYNSEFAYVKKKSRLKPGNYLSATFLQVYHERADSGTATIAALEDVCSGVSKHRSIGCVHILTVAGFSDNKTTAIAEYLLYNCTTREALI